MSLGIMKLAGNEKKPQVLKKYQHEMLTDPFVEKVEKFINNPDLQDLHILTVARQAGVDPEDVSNAHLLFFVHNFIHKQSAVSNWTFRSPQEGESYWINHEYKRISGQYPFLDDLKDELETHIQKLEFKTLGNRLKKLAPFRKILKTSSDQDTIQ